MSIVIDRERCLACGICADYCVLDNIKVETPPCKASCPVGINPQAYCTLLAMDRADEALSMVFRDAPFPRVLGYVCHAPCERKCNRALLDQAVSIKDLKRYLVDEAIPPTNPWPPGEPTGRKAAIVGAGPAGMMAAAWLRRRGHAVTLFDALPEAGGMMVAGIPRFHLPDGARRADCELLGRLGVELKLATSVGSDVAFEELARDFDAVLLAVGAHKSEGLHIEGSEAAGVLDGLSFLRRVNLGDEPAVGRRVLVIGGGNVAVDAARVALRLGAQDVQLACLEHRDEMPAFPAELAGALEEGVSFNCTWGPERFLMHNGKVTSVEFKRCVSTVGPAGRFQPVYDLEQMLVLPADTVIVAVGQSPDLSFIGSSAAAGILHGSRLGVDPRTMATPLPGVFAAGDMVSGPSSVVEAMASGRRAARHMDFFLMGQDPVQHRVVHARELPAAHVDFVHAKRHDREPIPRLSQGARKNSFEVVDLSYDKATAMRQADRCLRCAQAVEFYRECWYCLPCEIECPTEALALEIPFLVS
jgi:NADPH-dependent glutamate synthase beta subunit-like oxidoreductase